MSKVSETIAKAATLSAYTIVFSHMHILAAAMNSDNGWGYPSENYIVYDTYSQCHFEGILSRLGGKGGTYIFKYFCWLEYI